MVSIIVPIYNAEKYLECCIRSIVQQTYKDIEIFLINDGSTDNSENICNSFAKKDKRIKYFCQKNQGPSKARNLGLNHIRGEFLLFVDADDWLEENAIEIMVNSQIKMNADLGVFGMKKQYKQNEELMVPSKDEYYIEKDKYIEGIIKNDGLYGGGFITAKLWRVDCLKNDNKFIEFDIKLKAYEDKLWIIENVNRVRNIVLYPYVIYNYRIYSGSLSHNESLEKIENCILAYEKISLVSKEYCSTECMDYIKLQRYYLLFRYLKEKGIKCNKVYRKQIVEQRELVTKNKKIKITTKIRVYFIIVYLIILEGMGI